MSHDRGCPCGKEFYEYEDCTDTSCNKRKVKIISLPEVRRAIPIINANDIVGVSPMVGPIGLISELRKKQYDALSTSDPPILKE